MIIDENIYLEHYGTLGMRWGVRNDSRPQRRREQYKGKPLPRVKKSHKKGKKALKIGALAATGFLAAAGGLTYLAVKELSNLNTESTKAVQDILKDSKAWEEATSLPLFEM